MLKAFWTGISLCTMGWILFGFSLIYKTSDIAILGLIYSLLGLVALYSEPILNPWRAIKDYFIYRKYHHEIDKVRRFLGEHREAGSIKFKELARILTLDEDGWSLSYSEKMIDLTRRLGYIDYQ